MIVDEDGSFSNSKDVTNLIVDKFKITTKTTGGYASWINGKTNDKPEEYTTWLEEVLLTIINMKANGFVQQKNNLNYIDAK